MRPLNYLMILCMGAIERLNLLVFEIIFSSSTVYCIDYKDNNSALVDLKTFKI